MKAKAKWFRNQAARARRLMRGIPGDPAAQDLQAMAEELGADADKLERGAPQGDDK